VTYRQRSRGMQAAWSRELPDTSTQSAEKQKQHLRRSSTHVGHKLEYSPKKAGREELKA